MDKPKKITVPEALQIHEQARAVKHKPMSIKEAFDYIETSIKHPEVEK